MAQVYRLFCLLLVCTVVGSLGSCSEEQIDEDELVVEGWICQNSHPIVLIHQSYAVNNPKHGYDPHNKLEFEDMMQEQMIIWGRVTIDDGTEQVVLTGRLDTLYTPPFVYTTTRMVGEIGKNYRITVDYKNYHAAASTAIQEPVGLDSLAVRLAPGTKKSHVIAYMSDVPMGSYYLLEYRTVQEHQFIICPLGTASYRQTKNGILSINVLSQDSVSSAMTSALHHFDTNDETYLIRVIRLDEAQYNYFSALTTQMASQGMYFMSTYRNIPSNIDGGIGYWAGFGKRDYTIKINRDTTYIY